VTKAAAACVTNTLGSLMSDQLNVHTCTEKSCSDNSYFVLVFVVVTCN